MVRVVVNVAVVGGGECDSGDGTGGNTSVGVR